jgi:hypothetical protein
MKPVIHLISLIGFLNTAVFASEVDFSNTYINPDSLSVRQGDRNASPVLRISGVKTIDTDIASNWTVILGFNPDDTSFHVLEAQPQNPFEAELLQQRLRGTIWKGDYKTAKNIYLTTLHFKSVQNGFIGGEIIHKTPDDDPGPSSFLHAKVTGDITTQYYIDEKGNGEWDWINAERYQEIVAAIHQDNEGKEAEDRTAIPEITNTRELIRLRRTRSLDKPIHANSNWGTQNEYRLTIENNILTGNVGSPPKYFGSKDVLTGNGLMELSPSEELETEAPTPE